MERNFIINPEYKDFKNIKILDKREYKHDDRMWKSQSREYLKFQVSPIKLNNFIKELSLNNQVQSFTLFLSISKAFRTQESIEVVAAM